jgi:hypothetical protein
VKERVRVRDSEIGSERECVCERVRLGVREREIERDRVRVSKRESERV